MKKLSEKDMALLAARGIKKFNTIVSTTNTIGTSKPKPKYAKKTKKVENSAPNPLVGKILHDSWGYDMTINEFCKILEVSPTGKTVKCRMVKKEGFNGFQGKVSASNEMYGPEFRLKIKDLGKTYGLCFSGSYPYCGKDGSTKKEDFNYHKGYFSIHNGGTVYENHMD